MFVALNKISEVTLRKWIVINTIFLQTRKLPFNKSIASSEGEFWDCLSYFKSSKFSLVSWIFIFASFCLWPLTIFPACTFSWICCCWTSFTYICVPAVSICYRQSRKGLKVSSVVLYQYYTCMSLLKISYICVKFHLIWLASGLGVNLIFDDHFDNSNAAICSHLMSHSNIVESVSSVCSYLNTYPPVCCPTSEL